MQEIDSPAKLPDAGRIDTIEEPVITAMILTPAEHVGGILQLCQDKRGIQKTLEYLASDRVLITYELPFNEVVLDFYDKLKTISRGYASLDYHVTGYWPSPLVKLDILVNGDPVDALSIIVHRDMAYERGRLLASKMRELIPRQMFEVAIQAAIGGRDHRARVGEGAAQERARQVLRRRHLAQAQAAREAEGRQEAHEAGRQGGDPAGSVSRRAQDGDGQRMRVEGSGPMADFKKSTLREYFESIVIAVILALFIRTFVVQAFKIPTGSMEKNLLIGDHLLVNKFVFGPTASRRSSGRCCRSARSSAATSSCSSIPEEPERDFIKRVIGLPGETVECGRRRSTSTARRSTSRTSHFLAPPSGPSEFHEVTSFDVRERYGPVTVPPNQYFVMGDNRDNSAGQPLLGLPAARLHQGQGAGDLLVVPGRARGLPGRERRRDGEGPGVGVRALLHAHALGSDVPPDALMIRTLLKLAVVALVANAAWHLFGAYSPNYKFEDADPVRRAESRPTER